jgi:hypothetical protein
MLINTNKTTHITTKNTTTTIYYTAGTSNINIWFGPLYVLYTVLTQLDKTSFTLLEMTLKSNDHCFYIHALFVVLIPILNYSKFTQYFLVEGFKTVKSLQPAIGTATFKGLPTGI